MSYSVDRQVHDQILANYLIPPAIIGTKPTSESGVWHRGDAADLRHDVWLICTDDPDKKKNAALDFSFEHVIDAGDVRLNSSKHVHDLITTKMLILERLRGQFLESVSATTLRSLHLKAIWILRWRNGIQICSLRELSEPTFKDFCACLRRGTLELIPWRQRLAAFEQAVASGGATWPLGTSSRNRPPRLVAATIGAHLGMPSLRGGIYDPVRAELRRVLSEISLNEDGSPESEGAGTSEGGYAGLTRGAVLDYLYVWQDLHTLSRLAVISHDRLEFDPFSRQSPEARSKSIARAQKGRTATLTPQQWLGMLDAAARWVLDFSDPILKITKAAIKFDLEHASHESKSRIKMRQRVILPMIQEIFPDKQGRPRLLPIWEKSSRVSMDIDGAMSLNDAVRYVVAASLILIGGFSARRSGELESLKIGCVDRDAFGQLWLSSYIEKTIRDVDKLPVPLMIGHAVQLLEDLSASGRMRTGTPWLSSVDKPSSPMAGPDARVALDMEIGTLIKDFAAANSYFYAAGEGEDSKTWSYASHELRRAFSVYYYHGNRFGNFDALSRFLRHFDPEMTRIYITEAFGGRLGAMAEFAKAAAAVAMEMEEAASGGAVSAEEARTAREYADAAANAVLAMKVRMDGHDAVRTEAFIERSLQVVDGIETPIGLGAHGLYADLEKEIEKARRHVRLVRPDANVSPSDIRDALPKQLAQYVKTHWMEPVSGGFAHCRCRPNEGKDLDSAVCLRRKLAETGQLSTRPDYAFASIENCLGDCPHGIAFSENQRIVDGHLARATVPAGKHPAQLVDDIVTSIEVARAATSGRGAMLQ